MKGLCQSQILITLSNSPGNITPGGHFTLFFDVNSTSFLPESLDAELVLPERWNLLSQRKPEKVAGQKQLRYFFVIGTPPDCASGDFPVILKLNSNSLLQTSKEVTVTIQEVRKLEVFVLSHPDFIKEGENLRVEYLVQNAGNSTEIFTVKTNRGIVEEAKDSLTLAPNEKIKLTVSQAIPYTEYSAWQTSSDLTVLLKNGEPSVSQIISIPVFSSKIRKIDRYFRFPVEVGGGYMSYRTGDRELVAFQYSATGRGYMDEKGKHYLDFTLRGPNRSMFPAIGSYDQYSVDYQYKKNIRVTLGDYVLQLNNLMEFGRFGRGVRFEQKFRKIGYSLFYQKARFYPNQKESFGGTFVYNFNETSNLAVSHISKNIIFRNQLFWSNLTGISSMVRTRDITVESELAVGNANRKTDYGAFLRFQLAKNRLSLSGNLIYAGKNFYGFYNNSLFYNGNIAYNFTKTLSIGVSRNFSNVNPSLDANVYSVSPKEKFYNAYFSFQVSTKSRFYVYYSQQEREDRQKPSEFHYAENFLNLSYNLYAEKFSLIYQGRFGKSRNLLVSDTVGRRQSFSQVIQPSVRFFPWIWVGGYLEYQHTSKFSRTDVIENLFFYGGNVKVNLKRNLFASFMYRNNYAPDELYVRRSFMDASVLLDLQRHKFTLTGGRSFIPNIPNSKQNTLFFSVGYALKLNVPLSRKKNIGRVRGKLTGEGFSKQGNLIQLGSHKFLTDSTGVFSFEGLPPDRYYLSILESNSKNDGVVPTVKMPMFIEVKTDSIKIVEVPLTRTGNITGKVEFLKANQNGLSFVLSQRPTILVKLANETESFLTELNDKDEFSFKEMKPGDWTLSAVIPGSQDRFVVDDNEKQLSLDMDKTMNIVFKVRPNEKRIHFSGKSFDLTIKK